MATLRLAPWLLLGTLLAACAQPDGATSLAPTAPAQTQAPPVRFIAYGDAGTGLADQHRVADAMVRVCRERGCDFALSLGDNIYDAGAHSPYDPQFVDKFESPYRNVTWPVWLVLGNHDNGDPGASPAAGLGPWYQTGNNQVAYSQRTDRVSRTWHMPARHYNVTHGSGTVSVDLFALDTNTLLYQDLAVPPDVEARVREQGDWIDAALAGSRGAWSLAFGHHPYVSNGPHGNAGAYDGRPGVPGLSGDYLKEFVEAHLCGKVDLYLAGHDHNLQWLAPAPDCGATEFIVSGGGGAHTYGLPGANEARFQAETLGFWWFEADEATLTGVAYDVAGQRLSNHTLRQAPDPAP